MAIITYPLNGIDYDAENAETYLCTRTSGVYSADGNFQASVTGDRQVSISAGLAWIQNTKFAGKSVCNTESVAVEIPLADGTRPRIDRIVLRFDKAANASSIVLKQGTPSSAPAAPTVERTELVYELGLCTVQVPAASTIVSVGNVTSTLLDESVCGLMRDGVTGIPTEQLQEQVTALLADLRVAFEKQLDLQEQDFDSWLDTIKGKLGDDPATALQSQVDDLQAAVGGMPLELSAGTNSINVTADENRVGNVEIKGFTTQTGSGDPSPENIRPIENAGADGTTFVDVNGQQTQISLQAPLHEGDTLETNVQSEYDAYAEFDGSSDENWLLDSGSTAGADGSKRMWIKLTGPQTENTSDQAVPVAASNQLTAQSVETTYIAKAANCFDVVYSGATNMLHVRIAGIDTVEALKTHLQSHPLRVFYKSASGGAGRLVRRETHTRKTLVLDGDAAKFTKAGSYWNLPNQSAPNVAAVPKCVCSSFPGSVFQANQTYNFLFAAQAQLTPYFDDLDACNAFLAQQYAAGTPVTVEYDLAAPEVYVDEPVQPQNPAGTCTLSGESGTRLTATVSPPVGYVNGKSGASVTLTKADIGLSNVDNTPDAQKNVKGLVVERTDVITGLSTGLYYYKANTPGAPSTVDGLLLALVYMPFGVQLAFPTNSGIYFRWAVNNWSEWARLDQQTT